jgi:chromosome segregation ATPase
MRQRWIVIALCAVVFLVWAGRFSAQQNNAADAPGQRLVQEVAGLNRSVQQMVNMLSAHLDYQQVELLLKRIELKERRIAPIAGDLREVEHAVFDAKNQLMHMQEMLRDEEDRLKNEIRDGVDQPESETRLMIEQYERAIEADTARLDGLERRMRRLEDELADGRDEIEILDDTLQELLE